MDSNWNRCTFFVSVSHASCVAVLIFLEMYLQWLRVEDLSFGRCHLFRLGICAKCRQKGTKELRQPRIERGAHRDLHMATMDFTTKPLTPEIGLCRVGS